jgi:pimeloyl-ACP methyl ester carboxylesterase
MPFAPAAGTSIYYEVHGRKPGDAPALVFAHGAGGNHLSWFQQVPHFAARYTCVTFDHRGFGQSVDPPGGPSGAAFVDDLRALLDHAGVDRATLVAQSMGGWTCLGFALRYPQRVERLVLAGTHGGIASDDINRAWAASAEKAAKLADGVHPACGERLYREQPGMHFLYIEISNLSPDRSRQELGTILSAAGATPVERAASLTMPVLFITGDEDIVIPPAVIEIAASHVPHARIVHVPEAGHSTYFERPAVFNDMLDRFLSGRLEVGS